MKKTVTLKMHSGWKNRTPRILRPGRGYQGVAVMGGIEYLTAIRPTYAEAVDSLDEILEKFGHRKFRPDPKMMKREPREPIEAVPAAPRDRRLPSSPPPPPWKI